LRDFAETQDRRAILDVHKEWWESCRGSDIPRMAKCFPSGPNYLMFNLNTHPYFGIAEKVRLWEHYKSQLDKPEFADVRIMRFDVARDMAWIATEGLFPERQVGPEGRGSAQRPIDASRTLDYIRFRATEIYRRDDGSGHPSWRIWHLHASLLCPPDEPRPGIGDTSNQRGLGGNPWGPAQRVAGVRP
jgi:ketosteroid isomerase-like protein